MKKPIFLLLFVFLVSAVGVSAQQETFQEETFQNHLKTAFGKLTFASYRKKTSYESLKIGSSVPDYAQTTITERVSSSRRYYFEKKSINGKTTTYESITIGNDFYFRENNGKWMKRNGGRESGNGIGNGSGSGGEKRIVIDRREERNFSRDVQINDQTANLFETIFTTKYTYLSNTYTIIRKLAYWFDSEGRLIKSSKHYENTESQITTNSTEEYEYDAEIKIEVPVVEKEN